MPKRILNIITCLDIGGAEMMLFKLLSRLDREKFTSTVVSLLPPGPVAQKIQSLGIRVDTLNMHRSIPSPFAFWKLIKILNETKPDIVQTWLYHADFIGALASLFSGAKKLVWNIRCSDMKLARYGRRTAWIVKSNAALSFLPVAVLANSKTARSYHEKIGYRPRRFQVIDNGFDTELFRPDPFARKQMREELGIQEHTPCVGLVARFDPVKDHQTFIQAAGKVIRRFPDVLFILCGDGVKESNRLLKQSIAVAGIQTNTFLLGRRDDIPRIMAGLDVLVSASAGEGFPNVIGEAMACGLPCIVTDVGDSARIVGPSGIVITPGCPDTMGNAIIQLLSQPAEERLVLGESARKRVQELFRLDVITNEYEEFYTSL